MMKTRDDYINCIIQQHADGVKDPAIILRNLLHSFIQEENATAQENSFNNRELHPANELISLLKNPDPIQHIAQTLNNYRKSERFFGNTKLICLLSGFFSVYFNYIYSIKTEAQDKTETNDNSHLISKNAINYSDNCILQIKDRMLNFIKDKKKLNCLAPYMEIFTISDRNEIAESIFKFFSDDASTNIKYACEAIETLNTSLPEQYQGLFIQKLLILTNNKETQYEMLLALKKMAFLITPEQRKVIITHIIHLLETNQSKGIQDLALRTLTSFLHVSPILSDNDEKKIVNIITSTLFTIDYQNNHYSLFKSSKDIIDIVIITHEKHMISLINTVIDFSQRKNHPYQALNDLKETLTRWGSVPDTCKEIFFNYTKKALEEGNIEGWAHVSWLKKIIHPQHILNIAMRIFKLPLPPALPEVDMSIKIFKLIFLELSPYMSEQQAVALVDVILHDLDPHPHPININKVIHTCECLKSINFSAFLTDHSRTEHINKLTLILTHFFTSPFPPILKRSAFINLSHLKRLPKTVENIFLYFWNEKYPNIQEIGLDLLSGSQTKLDFYIELAITNALQKLLRPIDKKHREIYQSYLTPGNVRYNENISLLNNLIKHTSPYKNAYTILLQLHRHLTNHDKCKIAIDLLHEESFLNFQLLDRTAQTLKSNKNLFLLLKLTCKDTDYMDEMTTWAFKIITTSNNTFIQITIAKLIWKYLSNSNKMAFMHDIIPLTAQAGDDFHRIELETTLREYVRECNYDHRLYLLYQLSQIHHQGAADMYCYIYKMNSVELSLLDAEVTPLPRALVGLVGSYL